MEQADVHAFVTQTLPLTVVFPVVVLARAILRGLIVRSGETHWTIWTSVVGLVVLIGLQVGGFVSGEENGSFPAAWAWLLALLVEALLSGLALLRIGLPPRLRRRASHGIRSLRGLIRTPGWGPRTPIG